MYALLLQQALNIALQRLVALVARATLLDQCATENAFQSGRDTWIEHTYRRVGWIVRRRDVGQGMMHTGGQRVDTGTLVVGSILQRHVGRYLQLPGRAPAVYLCAWACACGSGRMGDLKACQHRPPALINQNVGGRNVVVA